MRHVIDCSGGENRTPVLLAPPSRAGTVDCPSPPRGATSRSKPILIEGNVRFGTDVVVIPLSDTPFIPYYIHHWRKAGGA